MRSDRRLGDFPSGFPTRTGYVNFEDIVHNKDVTRTIVLGVDFKNAEVAGRYEVHIKHWEGAGGVINEEHLHATLGGTTIDIDVDSTGYAQTNASGGGRFRTPRFVSSPILLFSSRRPDENAIGRAVQRALTDRVGVFRFDPTALKTPAELGRTLSATGYNFANYLDKIQNDPNGRAVFDALLERFRVVCPHVKDITLPTESPGRSGAVRKRISLVMSTSSTTIPADLESDGTILMLAYASLLHGEMAHDTLCIEEPENGVHPKIIPTLVRMLRELSQPHGGQPGAQILVCTHSRKFFDEVESQPKTIRLVRRGGGGDGRSTVEIATEEQRPVLPGWAGLS